jgi:tetratricopeptide (TPR) repeat protein
MTMRFPLRLIFFIGIALLILCAPALAYSGEATGWYNQGNTLLAADNLTGAIAAYDRAIALEPAYFEAWDAKADALNRNGQFSDAKDASAQALAISPGYSRGWINRGQILYNIGMVYEDQKGDLVTANEYYNQQILAFDKAIALEPGNADAWFNKAFALAGLKRYDEAIAAFDKVKELNPDYPKLAQNRRIAEQLRDQATPVYVKYAPVLFGAGAVIFGVVIWFIFLRKKEEE